MAVLQSFTSLLSASLASYLHSLGVASGDIHRLLQHAANLSSSSPPPGDDDVTATMTSRLVADTRQLVLDIGATPIADDHVTEMYRNAENGRQVAERALNATQQAMYAILIAVTYLLRAKVSHFNAAFSASIKQSWVDFHGIGRISKLWTEEEVTK